MGRFKIGIILLTLLLAVALGAQRGMEAAEQPVTRALEQALEQVQQEDFSGGGALVARARREWERARTLRAALTDHQWLEDIDSRLAMLTVWAQAQEKADFAALCTDTLLRLKALAKAHTLNLSTLF